MNYYNNYYYLAKLKLWFGFVANEYLAPLELPFAYDFFYYCSTAKETLRKLFISDKNKIKENVKKENKAKQINIECI